MLIVTIVISSSIMKVIFLQVKSSIVKQLSAVQVETVERILQTSNVIAEAVSIVEEVTAEAQVNFQCICFCHKSPSSEGKANQLCGQKYTFLSK